MLKLFKLKKKKTKTSRKTGYIVSRGLRLEVIMKQFPILNEHSIIFTTNVDLEETQKHDL